MTDAIRADVGDFNDVRRALRLVEMNRTANDVDISTLQSAVVVLQSAVLALQSLAIVSISSGASPYAVAAGVDVILSDDSGGDVEVDLPASASNSGRMLHLIRIGTGNSLLIDPNGTEELDGSNSTQDINGTGDDDLRRTLICDGTAWWTLSKY